MRFQAAIVQPLVNRERLILSMVSRLEGNLYRALSLAGLVLYCTNTASFKQATKNIDLQPIKIAMTKLAAIKSKYA